MFRHRSWRPVLCEAQRRQRRRAADRMIMSMPATTTTRRAAVTFVPAPQHRTTKTTSTIPPRQFRLDPPPLRPMTTMMMTIGQRNNITTNHLIQNRRNLVSFAATGPCRAPAEEKEKSTTTTTTTTEPTIKKRRSLSLKARKTPVALTAAARTFFQKLLLSSDHLRDGGIVGIMLDHHQSTSGEPRMVYSFRFVTSADVNASLDEAVPLWENEPNDDDEQQKDDDDAKQHRQKKSLYVHHNAFLKVLGATLDVDMTTVTPVLYDREGNVMDPNA